MKNYHVVACATINAAARNLLQTTPITPVVPTTAQSSTEVIEQTAYTAAANKRLGKKLPRLNLRIDEPSPIQTALHRTNQLGTVTLTGQVRTPAQTTSVAPGAKADNHNGQAGVDCPATHAEVEFESIEGSHGGVDIARDKKAAATVDGGRGEGETGAPVRKKNGARRTTAGAFQPAPPDHHERSTNAPTTRPIANTRSTPPVSSFWHCRVDSSQRTIAPLSFCPIHTANTAAAAGVSQRSKYREKPSVRGEEINAGVNCPTSYFTTLGT
uniref:Uncharacterized protein n=1 Tax=Plectus sambesii TaxID=2011161 RepID=A0A914XMF3_9BILA